MNVHKGGLRYGNKKRQLIGNRKGDKEDKDAENKEQKGAGGG